MRAATGPDFGLMIDAHSWWRMGDRSYTPETVAGLARAFERSGPTLARRAASAARSRRLSRAARPPPASRSRPASTSRTSTGFTDLIETGAADFIQMDVCCQGGLDWFAVIAAATEARTPRFAFHSWGTTLEVLAAAHIGVCWPESVVEWLEYPCYANGGARRHVSVPAPPTRCSGRAARDREGYLHRARRSRASASRSTSASSIGTRSSRARGRSSGSTRRRRRSPSSAITACRGWALRGDWLGKEEEEEVLETRRT